jgi:hypothetical protein
MRTHKAIYLMLPDEGLERWKRKQTPSERTKGRV